MLLLSSCDFSTEPLHTAMLQHLPKPIEDCRLLFIPNEKALPRRLKNGTYLHRAMELGFSEQNISIFNRYEPEPFFGKETDVLYIGGGNTFCMMDDLRRTGFDKEILRLVQSGVTYIGASAGAHLVSQNIRHVQAFDENLPGLTDFSGLGLFPGILVCHYDETRRKIFEKLQKESPYPVFALKNDDLIVYPQQDNPFSETDHP